MQNYLKVYRLSFKGVYRGSFCTDTAKASSSEQFGGQPHREEMICVDFFVNLVRGEMTLIYYFSSTFIDSGGHFVSVLDPFARGK